MGPLPAVRRAVPRPMSASRTAVLDAVRSAGRDVDLATVAATTGLHPNTVREHLTALVRSGVVARARRPPTGRGRPAWLYSVSDQSASLGVAEYAGLASALARTLARSSAQAAQLAVTAGTEWGHELAGRRPGARAGPEVAGAPRAAEARNRVIRMLRSYGFAPRPAAEGPVVRLTRCPLLETAREHPEVVCSVHLGIVRGALEVFGGETAGAALEPFAEPGACRLILPLDVAGES